MKSSLVVRALGVVSLAAVLTSAVLTTAPASAVAPPLSEGCSTLHAGEQNGISSQGTVTIASTFAVGEQIRLTPTGSSPAVTIAAPDGIHIFTPASGDPVRFDVTGSGQHTLTIKNQPSGPISLTFACGVPPRAVVSTPAEGATYGVNDVVTPSVSCVAGTNAPTCTPDSDHVDTSSAGAKSYRVVAADGSGLQTATTVHYTIARKVQTLHFTSPPITDAIVGFRYFYTVTAESSSGLPVELSSDPGTDACQVSSYPPFIYGNVIPWHAGPCTVFADQPGNDEYLPAERISTTFDIAPELTTLDAAKASKGLLGISGTTFSADLHRRGWFGPSYGAMFAFPGQTVKFYVGGKLICSAVTQLKDDGTFFRGGVATCKAPIGVQAALKYNSYTAVYEGERDSLPSTAIGRLQ